MILSGKELAEIIKHARTLPHDVDISASGGFLVPHRFAMRVLKPSLLEKRITRKARLIRENRCKR